MSDNNVTQLTEQNMQETPSRDPMVKRVVILAVVVVAVCCLIALFLFNDHLNLDTVLRWGKYLMTGRDGEAVTYTFDSHSSNRYEAFEEGLAVASIGGLNIYDKDGDEDLVMQKQLELPALMVNEDMALAYDVGGHSLVALHKKRGPVLDLDLTHPILDAYLSEGGTVCLSSSESGYRSVLSAYNDRQELIYRWLSSSTYFPCCAISSDGKVMAAVALGQTEGAFESTLCLFKTDSEQIQSRIGLGNDLIYDLAFLSDELLCAVGENAIQFVSLSGDIVGVYPYDGAHLKDIDLGGDGFLTLTTNKYKAGNRFSLVTVNERGKELRYLFVGKEILDLSACGRYIAALTPGKLTVYTRSLAVYYEITDVSDVTSVVMRKDGTVLLVRAGEAELYVP